MICIIRNSKIGPMRLELLRDKCIISVFPFNIAFEDAFKFNTHSGRFFLKSDKWIEFSTLESEKDINPEVNDIFKYFSTADIMNIKNIVLEAIKWTEFWHCLD